MDMGIANRLGGSGTMAQLYGSLFEEVQMRDLFQDGKSFVDAVPRRDPMAILADYGLRFDWSDDALRSFVRGNFDIPEEGLKASPMALASSGPPSGDPPAGVPENRTESRPPIVDHITALWDGLERAPVVPANGSSELVFEGRHVVPGGRFREIYYWDSYFTMLGLKADGRQDLIEEMLEGFTGLVERHGHIPNGARTYYLSRSQPPFLYLMMALSDETDPAVRARRLDALIAEHRYWTEGAHMVAMPDGALLNRYWDDCDAPRDESYREDVETARASAGSLFGPPTCHACHFPKCDVKNLAWMAKA